MKRISACFIIFILNSTQASSPPKPNYNKNCLISRQQITTCKNITLKENVAIELKNYTRVLKIAEPIQEIPAKVFARLPRVETLIINYTLMERIYAESFYGLSNLKELDLYWNQISYVPPSTFHFFPNLVYLNIGGNNLEYIESAVFRPMKNLRRLIISSNLLTSVPDLRNLDRLELLDLSGNKIRDLHKEAFRGLFSLTDLNLKGNQLRVIEDDAFAGLSKLLLLNVEKNELEIIDVGDIKENLPMLREIRLKINRFACDVLEEVVGNFTRREVHVPEGLAEPGPITRHGIFCFPIKREIKEY